jgi:PhoD-like phosphatase
MASRRSDADPADRDGLRALTRRTFLAGSAAVVGLPSVRSRPRRVELPTPDYAATTIDDGGLLAAIRTTAPGEVMLRAWPTQAPTAVQRSLWYPTNAAQVAEIALPTAGTPGVEWSWQALVRDPLAPDAPPAEDIVRTIPARPAPASPASFTFAFGCCTTRGLGPSFDLVYAASPQFFAMIGDFGYPDSTNGVKPVTQDYGGYARAFSSVLRNPRMAPILGSMPFFPMLDDHDYGRDNCDRTTIKPFAGQAFADVMPGGRFPGRDYRSWSIGDADFFLTDNRRWRDPEQGPFGNGRYMSVLGSTQRTWLLRSLEASTAAVKFVFIPMTMAWYWSRAEATELRQFITDRVSGTVIFLSGDKHAAAFARYSPRIWEFLAAPLYNSRKHTTPARNSAVIWTENGTGVALSNVVGLVDVDTLTARTCTLRLVREDGVELHREVVRLAAP